MLITVPFAWYMTLRAYPELKAINTELKPLITKSDFGALRYIHFLAVAYLAFWAVGEGGRRLAAARGLWGRVVDTIRLVGQQSLAVFVTSLVIAQSLGVVLDLIGRSMLNVAAVNLFGFACLIATAWVMRWYKSEPWRKAAKAKQRASAQTATGPGGVGLAQGSAGHPAR